MGVHGVPLDKMQILHAISLKKGIITHAAEYLGCGARSIYNWMDNDPEVNQAVIDARAEFAKERADLDVEIVKSAYKTIASLIDDGDVTATIFALKTKAGWSERNLVDTHVTINLKKPYEEIND